MTNPTTTAKTLQDEYRDAIARARVWIDAGVKPFNHYVQGEIEAWVIPSRSQPLPHVVRQIAGQTKTTCDCYQSANLGKPCTHRAFVYLWKTENATVADSVPNREREREQEEKGVNAYLDEVGAVKQLTGVAITFPVSNAPYYVAQTNAEVERINDDDEGDEAPTFQPVTEYPPTEAPRFRMGEYTTYKSEGEALRNRSKGALDVANHNPPSNDKGFSLFKS